MSIARLAINASQYRLVLIDEPPVRQLSKKATIRAGAEVNGNITSRRKHKLEGEKGATSDVVDGCEIDTPEQLKHQLMNTELDMETDVVNEEEDEEVEISDVFRSVFPYATVIIVAHHASTLR